MPLWKPNNQGKFDPVDFVVPPEQSKGSKSLKIQAYIQAGHYRYLTHAAQSGHFPWQERADVIRWCIAYGIKHLETVDPSAKSIMGQANFMLKRIRESAYIVKYHEMFEESRKTLVNFIMLNEPEAAREEVAALWEAVQAMPETPAWALRAKHKYVKGMRETFGQYLPEEPVHVQTQTSPDEAAQFQLKAAQAEDERYYADSLKRLRDRVQGG
jgi:hypothetical protein